MRMFHGKQGTGTGIKDKLGMLLKLRIAFEPHIYSKQILNVSVCVYCI